MRTQPWPLRRRLVFLLITCGVLLSLFLTVSQAQISLDGSFGSSGPLTGPAYTIPAKLGQLHGPNLFHSFGTFNLHPGESATFTGPNTVEHILSRVTGGTPSTIDGLLKSDIPGANLFLLNPSGFLFGPHASLDVTGSFHASTADVLRFTDRATFSARLNEKSTLTTAAPAAFGFLSQSPAGIAIDGRTLKVLEGKTISLVGGDLKIVGRHSTNDDPPTLSAPSGRINLVSVASPGNVTLGVSEPIPTVTVDHTARLGTIEVSRTALLSVSGDGGGTVTIRGSRLLVDDASIFADTAGSSPSAPIGIDMVATEEIILRNGALVTTDVLGAGTAGNIEVTAPRLEITTGAVLGSRAWEGSTGDTGNIAVTAEQVRITDGGQLSAIALSDSRGRAGTVTVKAEGRVELINGGQIASNTFAQGHAGGVEVRAGELRIDDFGTPIQFTGISSDTTDSSGHAGPVIVTVQGLVKLINGGVITSSSLLAQGHAGSVEVRAGELQIDDFGTPNQFTGIRSDTLYSSGHAGTVRVTVQDRVELINGAEISSSSTSSQGHAGSVEVRAGKLRIDGSGTPNQFTGIASQANPGSSGHAGTVTVTVQGLAELINGGQIASSTFARGHAGDVKVQAGELWIDDFGTPNQFTGIASDANQGSLGNAGKVTVTVPGLVKLINGARISSSTFAQGNAGDVAVKADELRIDGSGTGIVSLASRDATGLVGNVEVEAGTVTILNGGAISIEARQTIPKSQLTEPIESRILINAAHLHLDGEASITAESTGNVPASAVEIHARDFLIEGGSRITTTSAQASGGNIQVTARSMVRLRDSAITATVGGGPETSGGNITIDPDFVILENSQIVSDAFQGRGGNIAIEAGVFLADPDSGVSAVALDSEVGIDGEIDIRAPVANLGSLVPPLPPGFASVTELLRDQCAARLREGTVSSLVVRGRAGLPPRPESVLPSPLFRDRRQRMRILEQTKPRATTVAFRQGASAPEALRQGEMAFDHGDFEHAVRHWQQAVHAAQGEPHPQSLALAHLAHAYQRLGHYEPARQRLHAAQTLAQKVGDPVLETLILSELGNVHLALGRLEHAAQDLHHGLRLARAMNADELTAVILNNLGNLAASRGTFEEALQAYRESARLAASTGNPLLQVRALTHAARITWRRGDHQKTQARLAQASSLLQALRPSHETAYGWLSIGLLYADLQATEASLLPLAGRSFSDALAAAQAIGDARATSYAWGYLGKLYEDQGRYSQALDLTRRALFALQPVQAPEALYLWQWQSARLLRALGQSNAAIDAYRQVVQTLQAMRHEMGVAYGEPLPFRQTIGPLYAELLDLLLHPGASQAALEEARQLLESLKVVELQNHFQDECVAALRLRATSLDAVSQTAVVVYPILLAERTELLVSLPTGAGQSKLQRFAVPIGAERMSEAIRAFRHTLEKRTTRQYLDHAQTLYNWLIRPFEAALASHSVTTLVFVPDGALRTIPMAALHDGEQFLIQKYALAITPGLNLTDPRPLPRPARVLAVGLTQAAQGFSPLPYVETEFQAISTLYESDVLLNQDFQASRLKKTLDTGLFSIVHIASHGQFSVNLADTFILTADDKLTLDLLDQLLGRLRFRHEPIELLTLSACQTAAGDERAALGLAGVAVKAGARSALATLWYINDQASSELVAQFYRHLRAPEVSRAAALQRAQIDMLGDPTYQHPSYWAPFLLINNWL